MHAFIYILLNLHSAGTDTSCSRQQLLFPSPNRRQLKGQQATTRTDLTPFSQEWTGLYCIRYKKNRDGWNIEGLIFIYKQISYRVFISVLKKAEEL